jgi:DNA mismatch repair protein MSH5
MGATDDDFDDHVIAAVDLKDYSTVGCAYYSAKEEKIYLLGDSRSGGMEIIETCTFFLPWVSRLSF